MHLREFDEFRAVLDESFQVFDKPLTDPVVKSYWEALKDQPLATVRRRAEYHNRHGRFCPRPKDLRPPDERATPENAADEPASMDRMNREANEHWAKVIARDPEEGEIKLRLARASRREAQAHPSHPDYREICEASIRAQADLFALWDRRRAESGQAASRSTRLAETARRLTEELV